MNFQLQKRFPRHNDTTFDDWIIKPSFLKRIAEEIDPEQIHVPSMATIEAVLLALETLYIRGEA